MSAQRPQNQTFCYSQAVKGKQKKRAASQSTRAFSPFFFAKALRFGSSGFCFDSFYSTGRSGSLCAKITRMSAKFAPPMSARPAAMLAPHRGRFDSLPLSLTCGFYLVFIACIPSPQNQARVRCASGGACINFVHPVPNRKNKPSHTSTARNSAKAFYLSLGIRQRSRSKPLKGIMWVLPFRVAANHPPTPQTFTVRQIITTTPTHSATRQSQCHASRTCANRL